MIQTAEAVAEERRQVRLGALVHVSVPRRDPVTILDEGPAVSAGETALTSEAALAEEGSRPEEDITR